MANKYRSNLRFCKNNHRLSSILWWKRLQIFWKFQCTIFFFPKLSKSACLYYRQSCSQATIIPPWKRSVIPPTEQPLTRFSKRNRERQQNNLCRRKLHSLTRTSLSQPPINQSSPQTILRFRSLITFRRLPRRSFMLIPWTHWISNVGPAILVPRTNLNKRFPLTTHPRVLLRAISPFSSRIHTPFRRVSHPFLRSLGRCWTIEGVGWPRLLDQNEFEALTEADSRLTSRRSNYRIFIRTHSPDGQLLYRRVKANPIREKERKRERKRDAGIKRAAGFSRWISALRAAKCPGTKNYAATIIAAPAVIGRCPYCNKEIARPSWYRTFIYLPKIYGIFWLNAEIFLSSAMNSFIFVPWNASIAKKKFEVSFFIVFVLKLLLILVHHLPFN